MKNTQCDAAVEGETVSEEWLSFSIIPANFAIARMKSTDEFNLSGYKMTLDTFWETLAIIATS